MPIQPPACHTIARRHGQRRVRSTRFSVLLEPLHAEACTTNGTLKRALRTNPRSWSFGAFSITIVRPGTRASGYVSEAVINLRGGSMRFDRSSGILLHPTSLPGRFGIGDLGPAAYRFA